MSKKFVLIDTEYIVNFLGRKLFRIRALEDIKIYGIKAGDKGGYIETEKNLGQVGNAWVYGDAWVCGNARVCGDAQVYGNAWVYGDAWVCGNARVYGDAWVYGNARVCGDAWVYGDARMYGDTRVYGDAWVCGNARVYGDAWVYGNARVCGDAWVCGNARVCGDAQVYGNAWVCGNARVTKFFECVSVTNLKWSLTSLPKGIQVGCHFFSLKDWSTKYQEIGQQQGFTAEESKAYFQLMQLVRRIQRLQARKLKGK